MKKYLLLLTGLAMLSFAACTSDDDDHDHDDHDDHDHMALVIASSNENLA